MATRKATASVPATITANALARLLERAWSDADGNGPTVPGIKVRTFVRDNAGRDGYESLAEFEERPQYGGNRTHVYAVPAQTDPIVRGLAARMSRYGAALPLDGAVAPFVVPERKAAPRKARKAATTAATARKRPQGGSVPVQTMAPVPDAPSAS